MDGWILTLQMKSARCYNEACLVHSVCALHT